MGAGHSKGPRTPTPATSASEQNGFGLVDPSKALNVAAYMGKWYEVARTPYRFQSDKAFNVEANYVPLPKASDGFTRFKVINKEYTSNLESASTYEKSSVGVATQSDSDDFRFFSVRFEEVPSFVPDNTPGDGRGNYVICHVETDYNSTAVRQRRSNPDEVQPYSYAIVSSNDGDLVWFLSRTPNIAYDVYERLCKIASMRCRLNLSSLRPTPQFLSKNVVAQRRLALDADSDNDNSPRSGTVMFAPTP